MLLVVPIAGPVGFSWRFVVWLEALNQSEHHYQTFPAMLYSPKSLGGKDRAGAVPM